MVARGESASRSGGIASKPMTGQGCQLGWLKPAFPEGWHWKRAETVLTGITAEVTFNETSVLYKGTICSRNFELAFRNPSE
jgi:hypothetical protein